MATSLEVHPTIRHMHVRKAKGAVSTVLQPGSAPHRRRWGTHARWQHQQASVHRASAARCFDEHTASAHVPPQHMSCSMPHHRHVLSKYRCILPPPERNTSCSGQQSEQPAPLAAMSTLIKAQPRAFVKRVTLRAPLAAASIPTRGPSDQRERSPIRARPRPDLAASWPHWMPRSPLMWRAGRSAGAAPPAP